MRAAKGWKQVSNGIEVATLNPEQTPDDDKRIRMLMFSQDARLLLSGAYRSNTVWKTATPQKASQLDLPEHKVDLSCSTDLVYWNCFAAAGNQVWWFDREVMDKWDSQTGRLLTRGRDYTETWSLLRAMGLEPKSSGLIELIFSPNGKILAASVHDGQNERARVLLLDPASFEPREAMVGLGEEEHVDTLLFTAHSKGYGRLSRSPFRWEAGHCVSVPRLEPRDTAALSAEGLLCGISAIW